MLRLTRRERQFSGLKQGWYGWEMVHPVFYTGIRLGQTTNLYPHGRGCTPARDPV